MSKPQFRFSRKVAVLSIMVLILVMPFQFAIAGKLERVQEAIKNECKKEISQNDAIKKVKDLYLTCVPGTKVVIDNCQVDCLRDNTGAIVGQ